MAQWLMGGLITMMGVVAMGLGALVARHSLAAARRVHQRTASLATATVDGWDAWFLGGFSGLALGIRWWYAVSIGMVLALAGACLIGVGVRLATIV